LWIGGTLVANFGVVVNDGGGQHVGSLRRLGMSHQLSVWSLGVVDAVSGRTLGWRWLVPVRLWPVGGAGDPRRQSEMPNSTMVTRRCSPKGCSPSQYLIEDKVIGSAVIAPPARRGCTWICAATTTITHALETHTTPTVSGTGTVRLTDRRRLSVEARGQVTD
jgi:hypothetical protein